LVVSWRVLSERCQLARAPFWRQAAVNR
jgi:hypothetical protein